MCEGDKCQRRGGREFQCRRVMSDGLSGACEGAPGDQGGECAPGAGRSALRMQRRRQIHGLLRDTGGSLHEVSEAALEGLEGGDEGDCEGGLRGWLCTECEGVVVQRLPYAVPCPGASWSGGACVRAMDGWVDG
jgi:hypothetical protein